MSSLQYRQCGFAREYYVAIMQAQRIRDNGGRFATGKNFSKILLSNFAVYQPIPTTFDEL